MKKLAVIFLALSLRLILIPTAFHGDLYNNRSWGNVLIKYGPDGFYERTVWDHSSPNQPPLFILLFGLVILTNETTNKLIWFLNSNIKIFPSRLVWFWESYGTLLLLKLPSIIADLIIGFLIFQYFYKRKSENLGLLLASVWLFNPITWYNSSIWGQTDSIVNMLGLISIVFLLKKDLLKSTLFFTTSILFKPSLVVFLPIMSIIWVLQKHQIKDWAISFLASSSLIILVSFWFHPRLDFPIWLINLYSQKILPGEIGYLTANAFNLWYLINPGKVLDSTKFLGIQARIIGYLLWSAVVLIVLIKSKKELTKEKKIFMLLAISSLSAFLFFTRIHERYLYPFFPITTILIGFMPEMITAYVTLSAVFLLNMYNLFWAPGIPFLQNTLSNTQTPIVLSFINLLIFGLVFILGIIRKK